MFNLWKSVTDEMDPMEMMKRYADLSRVSEQVGEIAAKHGTLIRCDLVGIVTYVCESTKTPNHAEVAQLSKAFGCKLKRLDGIFQDDEFEGKATSYTFVHGNKGALNDYFSAGVVAVAEWPGLLAVHHSLTPRKDLICLLDGIAVLYGLEKAADLSKYRPADDVGLPENSAKIQLPKPFQDYLRDLGVEG